MTVPPTSASPFSLMCLQPVVDASHQWVALDLQLNPEQPADTNVLVRLFSQFGLGEALGSLSCLFPASDPLQLDPDLAVLVPAHQVILRVPIACCADPAMLDKLQQLREQGFRILCEGLPSHALPSYPGIQ